MLSNELKVAIEIERMNQAGDDVPYFSRVAERLAERGMKKTAVYTAVNRLIDTGTIHAEWEKKDSMWVRKLTISGESKKFISNLIGILE